MKYRLFNLFKKFFLKELKVWGVKFDFELPPEIIITNHAVIRIKERFRCNDAKIKKIVMKAWLSELPIRERFKRKTIEERMAGNKIVYKSFNGFIFVFGFKFNKYLSYNQKTLITVYSYKYGDPIL